jgi:hypothetical protein
MRLDLDNLPTDTCLLQQLVRDLADVVERQKTELAELEQLKLLLRQMKRAMFGRRSERLDPDQMQLALEDIEADIARAEEKIAPVVSEPAAEPEALARRRDPPDHLPHRDLTIEPADIGQDRATCPCCGGALHGAHETVSKMLDYVPAQIRVLCASVGPSTPVAAAARCIRRRRRKRRSRRDWRHRRCWPMSSSAATPTTCRSTDRPRSWPATVSRSTAPCSPAGPVRRAGGSRCCTANWLKTCLPRPSCSRTTRRCRR